MHDLQIDHRIPEAVRRQALTVWAAPWLASCSASVNGDTVRPTVPASKALTTDQIQQVKQAAGYLRLSLAERPTLEEVAGEVFRLLAPFPLRNGEAEVTLEFRAEAYIEALKDIPLWAIAQARSKVMRGEAGIDPKFAPTPPQAAEIARDQMRESRKALHDLERVARAEVVPEIDPATRARMAQRMDELRLSLKRAG